MPRVLCRAAGVVPCRGCCAKLTVLCHTRGAVPCCGVVPCRGCCAMAVVFRSSVCCIILTFYQIRNPMILSCRPLRRASNGRCGYYTHSSGNFHNTNHRSSADVASPGVVVNLGPQYEKSPTIQPEFLRTFVEACVRTCVETCV